ncbi:MAG: clostripain-related cysteine peptidase [Clostridia bacterium]|nr:clostripain-related cysteine peptidase [Clostridia bacterium]
MKLKRAAALLLALMCLIFCSCDDIWSEVWDTEETVPAWNQTHNGQGLGLPQSAVKPSDNGQHDQTAPPLTPTGNGTANGADVLQINRRTREKNAPMGPDGTWTIFVYLCGTDLETDYQMASFDLDEMLQATNSEQVRFVIQTGGTQSWYYDIDPDKNMRLLVEDGSLWIVDEQPAADMGSSDTLVDFLRWGIREYPAAKMGLILWNHGSGSIGGVCFDEFTDNSLSLRDIDAALYSIFDEMTDQFEFIGFDACLMSTVETAAILATHARYMVASEEIEPGYGWDYTAIGNYLAEKPNADGGQLGKVICDSYYAACEDIGSADSSTIALTDLSRIDTLLKDFHNYAYDLHEKMNDPAALSAITRAIMNADNFGGNNRTEGYTNMVDLSGLIRAGADYSDHADDAVKALNDAVIYVRNGMVHKQAGGLAVYYPLQVQGSKELSIFRDICISTYYLDLVDKIAYGYANGGDLSGYETTDFGVIGDWSDSGYTEDNGYYFFEDEGYDYWDYVDDAYQTGESSAITFDVEPYLDEDGSYGFVLSEEGLYNTASVQSSVFLISEDGEDIIELGLSSDIYFDWETGICCDNFDGSWFCLPDGQLLAAYLISEEPGYDIFTSPIMLNGEETNLRFLWDYEEGMVEILGVWDGMEESGAAGREITWLLEGDEILPLYYAYAIESDDEYYYYGEEYYFDGDPEIWFDDLPDGEYLYAFCIDDIFGDYYLTDYVGFTIDGDTIWFDAYD